MIGGIRSLERECWASWVKLDMPSFGVLAVDTAIRRCGRTGCHRIITFFNQGQEVGVTDVDVVLNAICLGTVVFDGSLLQGLHPMVIVGLQHLCLEEFRYVQRCDFAIIYQVLPCH